MKVDLGDVPFAGFTSQEIDFSALLSRSSPAAKGLLDVMIQTAVTAESDPPAGRFCTIVFVGHSDRDDTPGRSPEDRRALELQMSTLRAESAQSFFFQQMFDELKSQGFTPPVDVASMQNVEFQTIACGSADLINLTPTNEDQRAQNRRVHFVGTAFTPS
jgi:hypothetical protein